MKDERPTRNSFACAKNDQPQNTVPCGESMVNTSLSPLQGIGGACGVPPKSTCVEDPIPARLFGEIFAYGGRAYTEPSRQLGNAGPFSTELQNDIYLFLS